MKGSVRDGESPARSLDAVVAAVEAEGLASRGAFHVAADDAVPPFTDGAPAATLVLVGNTGPGMWTAFSASDEAADRAPDALDRWSRRVVSRLACSLGGSPALSVRRSTLASVHPLGATRGPRPPFAYRAARACGLRPVARLSGRHRVPRTPGPSAPRRPRQPLRELSRSSVPLDLPGWCVFRDRLRRGRVRRAHRERGRRAMSHRGMPRPARVPGGARSGVRYVAGRRSTCGRSSPRGGGTDDEAERSTMRSTAYRAV